MNRPSSDRMTLPNIPETASSAPIIQLIRLPRTTVSPLATGPVKNL